MTRKEPQEFGHFVNSHWESHLLQRDDEEGAAAGTLGDDGQVARVDGAEMVVVDVLGDGDPVEAVLPARRLPVNIPELGAAVLRPP